MKHKTSYVIRIHSHPTVLLPVPGLKDSAFTVCPRYTRVTDQEPTRSKQRTTKILDYTHDLLGLEHAGVRARKERKCLSG